MTDGTLSSIVHEAADKLGKAAGKKAPDLRQCHQYALFLAPLRDHGWMLFFLFIFLASFSALMTQLTRAQLPSPPVEETPAAATTTLTTTSTQVPAAPLSGTVPEPTSIPASRAEGGDLGDNEELGLPPPYAPSPSTPTPADAAEALSQNPSSTPAPTSAIKVPPPPRQSAAHYFVTGTACMLASIISLVFLALTIQCILFCVWGPLNDTATSVFYWAFFSSLATFATIGLGSWALLFRDLFGKKAKERWVFDEAVILGGLMMVIFFPLVLVGMLGMWLGKFIVMGVERCQAWCCSDALEEEERSGAQVELQRRMEGDEVDEEVEVGADEGSGSGSGDRDEERVGLIGRAEKHL